jgi:hypothetical protein
MIDRPLDERVLDNSLEFGREEQPSVVHDIVKRLLADAIAR